MDQKNSTKSKREQEMSRPLKYKNQVLLLLIAVAPVLIFIITELFYVDPLTLIFLGGGALVIIYSVFQWINQRKK
jgi:hypothetical protein